MTTPSSSPSAVPATDPERWLEEHGDCLFGFALFRVRKEEVAEDLVQDTLIAAFRAKDKFQGRSKERSWLVGILKNKIIDYYRKLGRETSFTDLKFFEDEHSEKFEDGFWNHDLGPQAWKDTSGAALDQVEFWTTFRNCLSKLPPRVADVFMLREMDDQSTVEICQSLNITTSNLWVMLHRARMALRECMETNWFGDAKKTG
jgi:RNA polymerase sigma-70 factor (ECF subfamily)